MCGRYAITSAPEAIRALFAYHEQPNFPPRYNVAPTQPVPVVRLADGKREFVLMRWGLLPAWVKDKIVPLLEAHAAKTGAKVKISAEGDKAYVVYDPDAKGDEYVARRVTLEFGARSTGEPVEVRSISCDAAPSLPQLTFPTARPPTVFVARRSTAMMSLQSTKRRRELRPNAVPEKGLSCWSF